MLTHSKRERKWGLDRMENSHRYPVTSNGHRSGNVVSSDGHPQARHRRQVIPTRPAPTPPTVLTTQTIHTRPSGLLDPTTIRDEERRRSIVDPDLQFEKFLTHDLGSADKSNILSSPTQKAPSTSPGQQFKPVIVPPPLRPQHVYAPMPVLGALSLGAKRRRKSDAEADKTDFSRLMNGRILFFPLLISQELLGLSATKAIGWEQLITSN